MNLDFQNRLSNAQAFSADAYSSNVIDLVAASSRPFAGEDAMCIALFVSVAADHTTGNETYQFELCTDDNSAMGSPTTLMSKAILYSALTAGSKHVIPLDPQLLCERYLALHFTGGGTTPTVTLSAFLCPMEQVDMYFPYADAITIS